ncbi:MAG: PTS sugar transporter subunit IIA [Spirochaetes bacterium]|nr:PTS sugar transporter subunit IIA [Spirochaetota bacterium]
MKSYKRQKAVLIILLLFFNLLILSAQNQYGFKLSNKMMTLVLQIGVILLCAKFGYIIFERLKLPGILGEIASGIIIGPYLIGKIPFYGFPNGLFPLNNGFLAIELYSFSYIASIILFFMIGLETNFKLFTRNTIKCGFIGFSGGFLSFIIGDLAAVIFSGYISDIPLSFLSKEALIIGAIATATSITISARILKDKNKIDSAEGTAIVTGSLIDDFLAILSITIVLSIITFKISQNNLDFKHILIISSKTILFWMTAAIISFFLSKRLTVFIKIFKHRTNIALVAFGMALILSGLFEEAGLTMIIGAYVMGLSLSRTDISQIIKERLKSLYDFLVPLFFCIMGMLVDIKILGNINFLIFIAVFSLALILAKIIGCGIPSLFCGFNIRGALRIGTGMIPRGETALIISGIGLSTGLISKDIFGISVFMILITSFITPVLLSVFLNNKSGIKKTVKDIEKVDFHINFPTVDIAELILTRLIKLYHSEKFFVHTLDRKEYLYQIRKKDSVIGIQRKQNTIFFTCYKDNRSFIYTSIYMVMVEFEQSLKKLITPLNIEKILKNIQQENEDNKSFLDISKYLTPELIISDLKGSTKLDVIKELVELLYRKDIINDKTEVLRSIMEKENIMSTGMQYGIAIPHSKTDSVGQLICAIGIKKEGVDFNSIDKKSAKIIILTISPASVSSPHAQFMSSIAQILTDDNIEKILKTKSRTELYNIFIGKSGFKKEKKGANTIIKEYDLNYNLKPELINLNLKGKNKPEIIEELLKLIDNNFKLKNYQKVKDEIINRENLISTGLSNGIAIPHCRTSYVDRMICAIGIKKEGIQFESLDNKPSYIIILTLSPKTQNVPHIQFMSVMIKSILDADKDKILGFKKESEFFNFLKDRLSVNKK